MTDAKKREANFTYQALARMSLLFYEKFDVQALPIIRGVWYELGLASGQQVKKKLPFCDFKSVAHFFVQEGNKGTKEVPAYEITDRLCHVTTPSSRECDVGLDNKGRLICEACMSINPGRFKAICGHDVEMSIVRSRATGADCCEVIYRIVDTRD